MRPQTFNPYPYVQNNPVNRIDPTGLDSEGVTNSDIGEFIRRFTQCPGAAEFLVVGSAVFITGAYYGQPLLVGIGFLVIMIAYLEYQQECLPPEQDNR